MTRLIITHLHVVCLIIFMSQHVAAQIGRRFPPERKEIQDPVTGAKLIFLTSKPHGDSKIYPTHPQWTSNGEWIIFRSRLAGGEAMAVHEETGDLIQVSEGGYTGMLNVAQRSMSLYFMRVKKGKNETDGAFEVIEVNLGKLFTDSKAGRTKSAENYQRVCGIVPPSFGAGGDMALDAGEEWVYFRVGREESAKHLPPGTKIEPSFGPRRMGAGPSGLAKMNIKTGMIVHVISVPFQAGHIQSNPWNPGEIIFCWETGGKSPQRTWTVMTDGTGLRPLYPESEYEWVTHEAVISKDEVAFAIMGHRPIGVSEANTAKGTDPSGSNPGQEAAWGPSGTREKPTGMAIVNLRTREMNIIAQTTSGSGLWHVHGSPDGRWAVADDFSRNIYLVDRNTRKMVVLSTGHKATAADHPHPTFSPDGTRISIQSAMLSEDEKTMNICVIPVSAALMDRDTK